MKVDYRTFSDASYRYGRMGYAYVIYDNNTYKASPVVSGIILGERNSCRGELWAIGKALQVIPEDSGVIVHSDLADINRIMDHLSYKLREPVDNIKNIIHSKRLLVEFYFMYPNRRGDFYNDCHSAARRATN